MPAKEARFVEVRERSGRTLQLPACVKCDYGVRREDQLSFQGDAYHKYCFKCALTCKSLVGEEVVAWRGQPYLKAALEGRDEDDVKFVDIWTNGGEAPLVEGAEFGPRGPAQLGTYGVHVARGRQQPAHADRRAYTEYPDRHAYTQYPDQAHFAHNRAYPAYSRAEERNTDLARYF